MAHVESGNRVKRLTLHHVLFICFTLISTIPVLFLAAWAQKSAIDNELSSVEEKHLLLARNLTQALSRYATDAESVFRVAAQGLLKGQTVKQLPILLETVNFSHICSTDWSGRVHKVFSILPGFERKRHLPPELMKILGPDLQKAEASPKAVIFTRAIRLGDGKPTLYLIKAEANGTFAIGSLATDYIVEAGSAISFGKLGHATIVDQTGQILAHPNPKWRAEIKNISKVKPVSLMLAGRTGVTTFFSPAVNADMIAGFTVVPKVGWGAMIPQPVSELEERAGGVRSVVLYVALFGIAAAAAISWWLAQYLAQPMQAVVQAAGDVAAGRLHTRISAFRSFAPKEAHDLVNSFNAMAGEINLNSQRLNDAQRIAGLGNWQWTLTNKTLWWSKQLYSILGKNPLQQEFNLEKFFASVVLNDQPLVRLAIEQARETGKETNIEFRICRPGGELRTVHQMIEVEKSDDGLPFRISATLLDITERKKIESDLSLAKSQAEEANESKSEFLASMSHDLRTPLNAIMGFSDIMRNESFGPLGNVRYEEYANDIYNSGALLVSLINDILDLSKVEAGKYQLAEESVEIPSLVQVSLRQLSTLTDSSRQQITVDVVPNLPNLRGDERALLQILNNLLSNAIKFTPNGHKITVSIFLDPSNCILLNITDTGPGMSREDIQQALKPFGQAEGAHTHQHKGSGLGLYLCTKFMQLFGGELKIESEIGEGTTVTLRFPADRTIQST